MAAGCYWGWGEGLPVVQGRGEPDECWLKVWRKAGRSSRRHGEQGLGYCRPLTDGLTCALRCTKPCDAEDAEQGRGMTDRQPTHTHTHTHTGVPGTSPGQRWT